LEFERIAAQGAAVSGWSGTQATRFGLGRHLPFADFRR